MMYLAVYSILISLIACSYNITVVYAHFTKNIEDNTLSEEQGPDFDDYQAFMLKLEEATKIATRTKLNSDYIPGIITVMDGHELLLKGCNTLMDAITIAPGFTKSGTSITVRGIGDVIYSGKLKYLINNVPINSTLTGSFNPAHMIPMEQIERIEIIRGPGATLYGQFAYAGVINIITHNAGNKISVGYGDHKTRFNNLLLSYKSPKDNYGINLNFSFLNNDRTGIVVGPDALYGTPNQHISLAPGEIDDSSESYLATLSTHYEDFSIIGQYFSKVFGSGYGFSNALPPLDESRKDKDTFFTLQTSWQPKISKDLKLNLFTGMKKHIYDEDDVYIYPPGFATPTGISYTDGMIGGPHYEDRSLYTGIEINYEGFDNNSILFGLSYEHTRTLDVWAARNFEQIPGTNGIPGRPLPSVNYFRGDGNWLDENISRKIFSVYLQDYFKVFNQILITAGIRYDKYNDVGEMISPRISSVYRLFDKHIFKLQYAKAFRPPSFLELYSKNNPSILGNKDIVPEKIKTIELGYFFKGHNFNAKTTVYYSELDDLIIQKGIKYLNTELVTAKGAEFELKWNLYKSLSIDGNCAFSKTNSKSTNDAVQGAMNWLGNAGILYSYLNQFYFHLQYSYVGDRKRAPDDSRSDLDAYHCFNLSAVAENVFKNELNVRFNVHNVFDYDIRYPATGYIEDYPSTGRSWMLFVSKGF